MFKFVKWDKKFILRLFRTKWVDGEFHALRIIPNWYIGIIHLRDKTKVVK